MNLKSFLEKINKKLLTTIIIFILLFAVLFSFNKKKEIITGEIRIVGTSLFYDLVISTEARDYYFDEKFFEEYAKYQGEIITIEAKIKKNKLKIAGGNRFLEKYIILWVKKLD